MKSLLLTFCCTLPLLTLSAQEEYMKSVVRITAQLEGIGEETGAGIIVGKEGAKYYIVTARHVVHGSDDIAVQVHGDKAKYKATVLHQDEGMDVAVLEFKLDKPLIFEELALVASDMILQGQKVQSIGHPGGSYWLVNLLNLMLQSSLYEDDRFFSITPQAVIGGCSGGPVFIETGGWLGMITETSAVQAKCLKAETIRHWLKAQRTPIRLGDFPMPSMLRIKGEGSRVDTFFFDIFITIDDYGYPVSTYCKELRKHIIKPFSIGKNEVTIKEFEAFIMDSGYETFADKEGASAVLVKDGENEFDIEPKEGVNWRHDEYGNLRPQEQYNFPVIHITVDDAEAYCKWLSKVTGSKYRLPSWQEWVYAFLPQNTSSFKKDAVFGNIRDETWNNIKIFDDEWCVNVAYKDGFSQIAPVGTFPQNALSIHDLYGNVSEWCQEKAEFYDKESGENIPCATYLGPNWLTWYTKEIGDCTKGLFEKPQEREDYMTVQEYYHQELDLSSDWRVKRHMKPYIPHAFNSLTPNCLIGFRVASD